MRGQDERDDQQTPSSGSAVGVFAVVMLAGGGLLWLLSSVAGLGDEVLSRGALLMVVVACALTVNYLVRQRRG